MEEEPESEMEEIVEKVDLSGKYQSIITRNAKPFRFPWKLEETSFSMRGNSFD